MKNEKYRKSMIPKNNTPMSKDLLKKHKKYRYYYVTIPYQKGDVIDKVLNDLQRKSGGTKSSILRNALFSYKLFIDNIDKKTKTKGESN